MAAAAVGQPDAYPPVHKITWEALAKCGARTRSGRPCRGLVVTRDDAAVECTAAHLAPAPLRQSQRLAAWSAFS